MSGSSNAEIKTDKKKHNKGTKCFQFSSVRLITQKAKNAPRLNTCKPGAIALHRAVDCLRRRDTVRTHQRHCKHHFITH